MTHAQLEPGAPHGAPAFSATALTVRYHRRAVLDDLTFQAAVGMVVLVGPNGSGKTTLLRVLATLRRPDAGTASVSGHDLRRVRSAARARQALGYLPQDPTGTAHLTVEEAVGYAAWLKGVPRRERADRITAALVDLDLVDRRTDRLGALSGGTRQRAHIAQAVVRRPTVLLLDEPSTGVDAEHRMELRRVLRTIGAGRLVVLSTHLTEDIELLADRVVALDQAGSASTAPRPSSPPSGSGRRPCSRPGPQGPRRPGRRPRRRTGARDRARPARPGPPMNTVAVSVRRSAGLPALAVLLALVVAHVLVRDRAWTHEWLWATTSTASSPSCSARSRRGSPRSTASGCPAAATCCPRPAPGRTGRGLGRDRVLGAAAYVGGLLLVVRWYGVRDAGLPPGPVALAATVAPARTAGCRVAGGLAWGGGCATRSPPRCRGRLLPDDAVAVPVSGPGELVVVGGATASLVSLTPRRPEVLQLLWFVSLAPGCWSPRRGRPGGGSPARRLASWRPALRGRGGAAARPGRGFLVTTTERRGLRGTAPASASRPGTRIEPPRPEPLLPYLAALEGSGRRAHHFRQNASPGAYRRPDRRRLILGDRVRPVRGPGAYLTKSCPVDTDPRRRPRTPGWPGGCSATVVATPTRRSPRSSRPARRHRPLAAAQ